MPSATPNLPYQQTAIVVEEAGKLRVRHDVPVLSPGPLEAVVKTAAVAINPVDAKMLDYSPVPGAVHGYDFAGTIVALGSDTPAHLNIGDRVASFVHGMNSILPGVGAFAEYVTASADFILHIPDNMTFNDAASIGLGLFTAGLGVFHELRVPGSLSASHDSDLAIDERFVLVAGGSTATGTRAIQLLKLYVKIPSKLTLLLHSLKQPTNPALSYSSDGLRPIATCSKSNADLARRFGAEEVFDYSDPDCASNIRRYTGGALAYALDCVARADTTQLCYDAIGRAGGRYVTLEPFRTAITEKRALTINPSWLLALTVFGRKVDIAGEYFREAQPDDHKFARNLTVRVQELLDHGKFDTHPIKVMSGGLDGVKDGVDVIRSQSVSGQKLVYPL
ncbi:hypothetical protein N7478_011589 [Penicillium angulare]|uniref:uncharacterized protein n=1 Tax=Penicillium angulare TaxID=116970 RepID=UPI002541903E|nr:uncharacterized protein N7478_011589 [Penicillium angulare]KAJ5260994.1 hypothetical protein N7478_011589 [Penicillium angulare]